MLTEVELRTISKEKLIDARALFRSKRYDGCIYLAGYVVETNLKARICRTLGWPGFPETGGEWNGLQSLKVHRLDTLLRFSGVESKIRQRYVAEWSVVQAWDPEDRYRRPGRASQTEAQAMIDAVSVLRRAI